MKKTFLWLILIVLSIKVAHAQTGWINYKLDNKLSVKFPVTPRYINKNTLFAMATDSSAYIVTIVDLKESDGLDSAGLVSQAGTQMFADSLRSSMLSSMAGYILSEITVGKWKSFISYNLNGGNISQEITLETFMVLLGTKLYGLSTILRTGKPNNFKNYYFSSLTLN